MNEKVLCCLTIICCSNIRKDRCLNFLFLGPFFNLLGFSFSLYWEKKGNMNLVFQGTGNWFFFSCCFRNLFIQSEPHIEIKNYSTWHHSWKLFVLLFFCILVFVLFIGSNKDPSSYFLIKQLPPDKDKEMYNMYIDILWTWLNKSTINVSIII